MITASQEGGGGAATTTVSSPSSPPALPLSPGPYFGYPGKALRLISVCGRIVSLFLSGAQEFQIQGIRVHFRSLYVHTVYMYTLAHTSNTVNK